MADIIPHDMKSTLRSIQIDLISDTPNQFTEWFNNLWDQIKILKSGDNIYYYLHFDDYKRTKWVFKHKIDHIFYNYGFLIKNFDKYFGDDAINYDIVLIRLIIDQLFENKTLLANNGTSWGHQYDYDIQMELNDIIKYNI